MPVRDLDRLLRPRTVAVVGSDPAERAIRQSDRLGFEGEIWPVHPTRSHMAGRRVYPSLDDLPGAPDAAFVAVNRHLTIEVVRQLAGMGCGGAVLYASGFAEAGEEGAEIQERLVRGHRMPLIGPNCYGTINAVVGAALWPDVQGCRRVRSGPALISQSGNISLNLTMNRRGIDFGYVISLGNQSSVTTEDCLEHFATRSEVTAVGIHAESIVDPAAFGRAALACRDTRTPVVVLKTGRSKEAERITSSHTAALAAPAAAYDALFERYGVATAESIPDFMTTLGTAGHDRTDPREPAGLPLMLRRGGGPGGRPVGPLPGGVPGLRPRAPGPDRGHLAPAGCPSPTRSTTTRSSGVTSRPSSDASSRWWRGRSTPPCWSSTGRRRATTTRTGGPP